MRRVTLLIGLLVFVHGLDRPVTVQADDSRPLYVEIVEVAENTYKLQLKTPPSIPAFNQPAVAFPADCVEVRNPTLQDTARDRSTRMIGPKYYRCEDNLSGRTVSIQYPGYAPSISSLMKLIVRTGETHTVILGPREMSWHVPEAETRSRVARDYTRLGIHHIWVGTDHLLFLICLLWIAGGLPRILTTITGFTLAHSVTLALSALDVIRVPVPPVEAVIALSVVFLATEIAKVRRDTLTWRYPIVVSGSFGLLHGLGFAAVLNEIGLPQTELVTGLLFFNVGVEIGQVLFAAVAATGIYLLKRMIVHWASESVLNDHLQTVMSYGVGCIASYWLIDRTVKFLDSSPI